MSHRLPMAVSIAVLTFAAAARGADPLRAGFANPPAVAKPQAWWHWMNGNVSRAGITADLEAMRQVGVGGVTVVNVDGGIPRGPVPFMSPEWRADFRFAVAEADRLGLSVCVENCAGWSSSGGPWVTPANAMQRLTVSRTTVDGPTSFDAVLPQPPTTLKTFRDVAVIAFRQPAPTTVPTSRPNGGGLVVRRATYGPVDGGPSAEVTARVVGLIRDRKASVVANNKQMGGDPAEGQVKQLRLEFTLDGAAETLTADEDQPLIFPTDAAQLAKARAAQSSSAKRTFVTLPPAEATDGLVVPRSGVVELTDRMGADGRLRWDVPPGRWVVLRLGHTPIGVLNHPAPAEGRGLECDKLSAAALDAHWAGFMQPVLNDLGPLAPRVMDSALIDSYEVGNQDWTGDFREQFRRRRGYDPVPFLPSFARFVVDDPAVTERFLWDVRRTVADLFAERYFGHFAELCHARGLASAVEPYTGPFESMQSGASADTVMGEFWTGSQGHPSIKLAASIAHAYGKRIVGAESFTTDGRAGRWQNDPYQLKPLGDLMFCQGLNRVVFHRYAHQPWTAPGRRPGMTMSEYGLEFERTQTWWPQAAAWVQYLARCQFMLQQGRAVADVAYFTGESTPVETRVGKPAMPVGYDYDAVDTGVLTHGATVDGGRVRLASGASYAVLVLPPDDANLTPATLAAIDRLVRDGATVVGPRPRHSPSLADYPACDAAVAALADGLWGPCDGEHVREHAAGRGRVVWGQPLADVLSAAHLPPDFDAPTDATLAYAHRTTDDGADLYFVSNQHRRHQAVDCTFRVSGKVPTLFHPDTGAIEPAPVWHEWGGRTVVRLDLDPAGSAFVVFRPSVGVAVDAVVEVVRETSPATRPSDLWITRAIYAAADGAGAADVTARLAARVRDGRLSVDVGDETMGTDPAVMHAKVLHVDYTLDGRPEHADVPQGQMLSVTSIASGASAEWVPTFAEDGRPAVRSWVDGRFTLRTASGRQTVAVVDGLPATIDVAGPWSVTFPPGGGAPPSVTFAKLTSWPDHPDAGVRYFSGTATYRHPFTVPAESLAGGREVWLDLGDVKHFADVTVNGRPFATLWKPPFRLDVTAAVRPGANELSVAVTNLWVNRLIGDEQLPPDCQWRGEQLAGWPQWLLDGKASPTGRLTFATWHHWDRAAPLLPSGLIGPVTIRSAAVATAR